MKQNYAEKMYHHENDHFPRVRLRSLNYAPYF